MFGGPDFIKQIKNISIRNEKEYNINIKRKETTKVQENKLTKQQ